MTPPIAHIGGAGLPDRIATFVQSWGSDGSFKALSLELFRYQYENNAPYRRFCDSRGASPTTIDRWPAIPAVPADAFRAQKLSCAPPDALNAGAVFRTSGTTSGGRGSHWMDAAALELYRLSLLTAFNHLAARAIHLPLVSLVAPIEAAPDSSLSFMVSALARAGEATRQPALFCWNDGGPDFPAVRDRLAAESGPILLFCTALALLELIENHPPLRLHPESIVIETGGSKGRRRMIEREELYRLTSERLRLPPGQIGSEYGMCEMASQFYDEHLGQHGTSGGKTLPSAVKVGPPWVRSLLIDPETGEAAESGKPGVLRHFDLGNLNSVLAIQTMDLAVRPSGSDSQIEWGAMSSLAEGQNGFILQGRLPNAPARGCSLTVEEWLDRTGGNH